MRAFIYTWHRKLSIIAGALTLLWVFSGLLHPFLSYAGPRPAAFKPPERIISETPPNKGFSKVLNQLDGQAITQMRLLKSERDWAWQVSTGHGFEYYDPDFGTKRTDFSANYAEGLARHYTGSDAETKSVNLQAEFDLDYPKINRLLPVYKIEFEDEGGLHVYVDPSSDRLGGLSNTLKLTGLRLFQWVHTLSFLDPVEAVRVLALFFAVLTILAISGLGIGLRMTSKLRVKGQKRRVLHGVAAYILWLPVLMMTLSGLFHLAVRSPLITDPPLPAQEVIVMDKDMVLPKISGNFSDLRLLAQNGNPVWRLRAEKEISYIDARTGKNLKLTEEEWARGFVGDVTTGTLVPMYTDEYGFAFKRLPVWRFEKENEISFVDPSEGLIAASVTAPEVIETWSFTRLHKWQFLDPYTGRIWRDVIVVLIGLLIAAMAVTGLMLRLRKRA